MDILPSISFLWLLIHYSCLWKVQNCRYKGSDRLIPSYLLFISMQHIARRKGRKGKEEGTSIFDSNKSLACFVQVKKKQPRSCSLVCQRIISSLFFYIIKGDYFSNCLPRDSTFFGLQKTEQFALCYICSPRIYLCTLRQRLRD